MSAPKKPSNISPYARVCLEALSRSGLEDRLSLGGAFGLAHYLEYRMTRDVDAWWLANITSAGRESTIETLEEALRQFGEVRTRVWGDVASVELSQAGHKVFSFQIASRVGTLNEPIASPWSGIRLDTMDDLIASKMTALIDRGAPRDFRDIHMLCTMGVTSTSRCWDLWQRRQHLRQEDASRKRATLAVSTHLARIAQSRPLASIADPGEREAAERLRMWFGTEFLYDLD